MFTAAWRAHACAASPLADNVGISFRLRAVV
jgi:hypothetical protein